MVAGEFRVWGHPAYARCALRHAGLPVGWVLRLVANYFAGWAMAAVTCSRVSSG